MVTGMLKKILLVIVFLFQSNIHFFNNAYAQPAQVPLSTNAAPVKPNILFILDSSGSMEWTNIDAPHIIQARGGFVQGGIDLITCTGLAWWDLDRQTIQRSPYHNEIYYNPTKRYYPGYDNNGVLKGNELPLTTDDDGFLVFLPIGADLSKDLDQKSFNGKTISQICKATQYLKYTYRHTCNNRRCTSTSAYFTVHNIDSFLGVSDVNDLLITTGEGSSLGPFGKKNPARTDCNGTVCTVEEERINIANWKKYHSNRMLAAKTGIGAALAVQSDAFRLGYQDIDSNSVVPVKDWSLQKTTFFTWLNGLVASGGTPLRSALDVAGRYFRDKKGVVGDPYNENPAVVEAESIQLTCRRNHAILVTDGGWNGAGMTSSDDYDSKAAPEIVHANGKTKYTYQPGRSETDPRNNGRSDYASGTLGYSGTLADVAHYYWSRDLRTTMANDASPGGITDLPFWQNMTTHTVGYGTAGRMTNTPNDPNSDVALAKQSLGNWYIDSPLGSVESAKIDDLIHTAHNGGGKFLQITDALSFANQLGDLIGRIGSELFSQAGTIASSGILSSKTKKFIPYYTTGSWWGNLKMQSMDDEGDAVAGAGDWQVVETDAMGIPTGVTTIPAPDSRNIFTMEASNAIPLNTNNVISFKSLSTIATDLNAFIRGDRSLEVARFRNRLSIFGDIANSTPVFVKNNYNSGYLWLKSSIPGATTFAEYVKKKQERSEGVVFVGANDGMLHAFREGTSNDNKGKEVFAYVPRGVHDKLNQLGSINFQHQFYVDGPLNEIDAFISASLPVNTGNKSNRWANILLGSLGAGGKSVYAIDVTDPLTMTAKSVLWEYGSFGDADVGYVMGDVQAGITSNGDWVAVFGNGKYSNSTKAFLYVVNLSNGTLIRKIETNTATSNGLGSPRLVLDQYKQIVGVYAGDLLGNMWRFDLTNADKSKWKGELLFTAVDSSSKAQPISAAPEVVPVYEYLKDSVKQLSFNPVDGVSSGYMVTFGTGKLYDTADQPDVSVQSAYGIWDQALMGGTGFSKVNSKTSLVQVTMESLVVTPTATNLGGTFYSSKASKAVSWVTDRGWYIDYPKSGQRTIFSFEKYQDSIFVSTIIPRKNPASCAANTPEGMNLIVNPLTGACPVRKLFDTNKDGKIDILDDPAATLDTNGDGQIDSSDNANYCGWIAPVSGPPVILSKTITVNGAVIRVTSIQYPDTKKTVYSPPVKMTVTGRSWRQIFPRQ